MKQSLFRCQLASVVLTTISLLAGGEPVAAAPAVNCGVPAGATSALALAPATPGGFFQAPTNWTTGRKRFLFIRVRMADDRQDPVGDADAEATLS